MTRPQLTKAMLGSAMAVAIYMPRVYHEMVVVVENHCDWISCFEQETGRRVTNWPQDCMDGPRREEWVEYRCGRISALVGVVGFGLPTVGSLDDLLQVRRV